MLETLTWTASKPGLAGGKLPLETRLQGTEKNTESAGFVDSSRAALKRILDSEGFVASPRLQQFLTYVTEETLNGRGERIRGKAIAVEVYGRRLDGDSGGLNLVRVEAQRLRRLLDEYYEGAGASEDIRIHIPVGGYLPSISQGHAPEMSSEGPDSDRALAGDNPSRNRRVGLAVGAVAVSLILGAVLILSLDGPPPAPTSVQQNPSRLTALRDQSVPRLQAANLSEQARGMFFPVFDLKRQALAYDMFLHAIDLDPTFSDGHAGAAQTMATIAALTPDADQQRASLELARDHALAALELSTADPWAIAAMAWVSAVSGEWQDAKARAQTATALAPQDGHVLDLAGIAYLMSGASELAADVSDPDRDRSGIGRFGARNIWGVSQLSLGNYNAVVEAFEGAAAAGAPVSAPSLVFQAVAHDKLGEEVEARQLVAELGETWPDFPAAFLVGRLFPTDEALRQDILETLARYGFDGSIQKEAGN